MPDVLQETYDRMSAERLAEAALLRAVGESQSIKVRAESYREYVIDRYRAILWRIEKEG
jgi:modulator of FtsH protease HflC